MALVNMPKAQAERWIALEFVTAAAIRTIYEIRSTNSLLGPSTYGVLVITYGILAAFALWDETADVAAIIGGLIVLAVMVRGTGGAPSDANPPSTVGRDVGGTLAGFAERTGSKAPTQAQGVTSKDLGGPSGSAGGGTSGRGGGLGIFGSVPIPTIPGAPSLNDIINQFGQAFGVRAPLGAQTNQTLGMIA